MILNLRQQVMRAKDENILYLGRNLVCDGSNFFDTGFAPFTSANINKDFMITMRLRSFTDGVSQAVVLGCKYEGTIGGQQYPGIYVRRASATEFEVGGYNYAKPKISTLINTNMYIWRKSGSYYYKIGTGSTGNLSVRSTTFDQNIVLGAGVQTDGTKFRYAKCEYDYIRIELL